MVVIDANVLMLLLRPDAGAPHDASGRRVSQVQERIEYLISELSASRTKIIIPTPALAEVLVHAEPSTIPTTVDALQRNAAFRVEAFDARAAIELAFMSRTPAGRKKGKEASAVTWAKLKYDRQIVAIAKVNRATAIYTDDKDLRAFARSVNISVIGLGDLPLPPAAAQMKLDLTASPEAEPE